MGNEYTREALYDLVWSVPKKQLAEQLGVSDVAIGKACKKSGIPGLTVAIGPRSSLASELSNRHCHRDSPAHPMSSRSA